MGLLPEQACACACCPYAFCCRACPTASAAPVSSATEPVAALVPLYGCTACRRGLVCTRSSLACNTAVALRCYCAQVAGVIMGATLLLAACSWLLVSCLGGGYGGGEAEMHCRFYPLFLLGLQLLVASAAAVVCRVWRVLSHSRPAVTMAAACCVNGCLAEAIPCSCVCKTSCCDDG